MLNPTHFVTPANRNYCLPCFFCLYKKLLKVPVSGCDNWQHEGASSIVNTHASSTRRLLDKVTFNSWRVFYNLFSLQREQTSWYAFSLTLLSNKDVVYQLRGRTCSDIQCIFLHDFICSLFVWRTPTVMNWTRLRWRIISFIIYRNKSIGRKRYNIEEK